MNIDNISISTTKKKNTDLQQVLTKEYSKENIDSDIKINQQSVFLWTHEWSNSYYREATLLEIMNVIIFNKPLVIINNWIQQKLLILSILYLQMKL